MDLNQCSADCARAAGILREHGTIDLTAVGPDGDSVCLAGPELADVLAAAAAARFRAMHAAAREVGTPPPVNGLETAVHALAAHVLFAAPATL